MGEALGRTGDRGPLVRQARRRTVRRPLLLAELSPPGERRPGRGRSRARAPLGRRGSDRPLGLQPGRLGGPPRRRALADLAFAIIGSGPAVTVGEEILYSRLTGEDECEATGLPAAEIERRLDETGPSGFDPRPDLEVMTVPGLRAYCEDDLSAPVERSAAVLRALRDQGKDFSIVVFTDCNHVWIRDAGVCQFQGPEVDWQDAVFGWLLPRLRFTAG